MPLIQQWFTGACRGHGGTAPLFLYSSHLMWRLAISFTQADLPAEETILCQFDRPQSEFWRCSGHGRMVGNNFPFEVFQFTVGCWYCTYCSVIRCDLNMSVRKTSQNRKNCSRSKQISWQEETLEGDRCRSTAVILCGVWWQRLGLLQRKWIGIVGKECGPCCVWSSRRASRGEEWLYRYRIVDWVIFFFLSDTVHCVFMYHKQTMYTIEHDDLVSHNTLLHVSVHTNPHQALRITTVWNKCTWCLLDRASLW